jgi:hypothetical protein
MVVDDKRCMRTAGAKDSGMVTWPPPYLQQE